MKKTLSLPITLLCSLSMCFVIAGCGKSHPDNATKVENPPPKQPRPPITTLMSPTTGLPEKNDGGQFFAAVVENYPDARPQTGLYSADFVYEMEAEGTITRYTAFYHDTIPSLIGPMRSARPYFVETSEDWKAPFIHFGGSPMAYKLLKTDPFAQIDGIYQDKYFSRDPSRVAPHNAYLHTATLPAYHIHVNNDHFHFGKVNTRGDKSVSSVSIHYNGFTNVKYVYQPETGRYLRYLQNEPDRDRVSGKQIYTNNIILQYATMHNIPNDPKERIMIDLNGPGEAIYLLDGKQITGSWKRTATGIVQYLDNQGKIIKLHPGKTWIEILDRSVPVELH